MLAQSTAPAPRPCGLSPPAAAAAASRGEAAARSLWLVDGVSAATPAAATAGALRRTQLASPSPPQRSMPPRCVSTSQTRGTPHSRLPRCCGSLSGRTPAAAGARRGATETQCRATRRRRLALPQPPPRNCGAVAPRPPPAICATQRRTASPRSATAPTHTGGSQRARPATAPMHGAPRAVPPRAPRVQRLRHTRLAAPRGRAIASPPSQEADATRAAAARTTARAAEVTQAKTPPRGEPTANAPLVAARTPQALLLPPHAMPIAPPCAMSRPPRKCERGTMLRCAPTWLRHANGEGRASRRAPSTPPQHEPRTSPAAITPPKPTPILPAPPQLCTLPSQPPPSPPPTPPRANSAALSPSPRPATGRHMPSHGGAAPSDQTTPPPRPPSPAACAQPTLAATGPLPPASASPVVPTARTPTTDAAPIVPPRRAATS